MTPAAKKLWQKALNEGVKEQRPNTEVLLFTHAYTSGGKKRTMCMVIDNADYHYAGTNYGSKGIITAFWANGHGGVNACRKD